MTIDDSTVSMAKESKTVRAREFQLAHAILAIGDHVREFVKVRFLSYRSLSGTACYSEIANLCECTMAK